MMRYKKILLSNDSDDRHIIPVFSTKVLTMKASSISSVIPGLEWTFAQKYFPYMNGAGTADAILNGGSVSLGFKVWEVFIGTNLQGINI